MKNNFIVFIVAFIFVFLYGSTSHAAINSVKSDQAEVTLIGAEYTGGKAKLALNFKLQPGWHIYWRIAGETGFPPTLEWTGSANTGSSEFMWPVPKRIRQEIGPDNFLESYVYENEVTFPITVSAKDPEKPMDIALQVSYAICAETCIPGDANLSINLQPGYKSADDLKKLDSAMDFIALENGAGGLKIESVTKADSNGKYLIEVIASSSKAFYKDATIFIDGGTRFGFYNPTTEISDKTAIFTVPATPFTDKKDFAAMPLFVTLVNGKDAVNLTVNGDSISTSAITETSSSDNVGIAAFFTMILFAFIGGLILNVMPCVLPILSIKLLGVIKHGGGHKHEVTSSFLLTALGIIVSFIAFAIITIWLKQAGEIVGWGLHFQQPYFIIALVVILTLFAANMWGFYEINLTSISPFGRVGFLQFLKKIGKKTGEGAQTWQISALTPTLSRGEREYFGHFMSGVLATVLATPCTAPFLGVAIGFAVTRGAFEILIIFLAMGLGLAFPYLLFSMFPGLVTKLPKPGKWMVTIKHLMGILLAISAVWLIWVLSNQLGKFAAIILLLLCALKVLKLWAANHYKIIQKIKIPLMIFIIFLSFIIPIKISNNGEHKVATEMWEEFRPEHIAGLVANGKIVFVDVTADWCLTCKVNKFAVLEREEMQNEFAQRDVIAMQADWTNRNSAIAKYLMDHKRAGIPFNIVYGPGAPDGIVLSELLSRKDVIEAIKKADKK